MYGGLRCVGTLDDVSVGSCVIQRAEPGAWLAAGLCTPHTSWVAGLVPLLNDDWYALLQSVKNVLVGIATTAKHHFKCPHSFPIHSQESTFLYLFYMALTWNWFASWIWHPWQHSAPRHRAYRPHQRTEMEKRGGKSFRPPLKISCTVLHGCASEGVAQPGKLSTLIVRSGDRIPSQLTYTLSKT